MHTARQHTEALIFAGGIGRRMGASARPKQFLELGGRPIIDFTLAHFAEHPLITRIVVACLADWMDYLQGIVDRRHYDRPIDIVAGGATGQESIFAGLSHLRGLHPGDADAIVLVHDGVRPLIDAKTITDCITSVETRGVTAVVAPATETIIVNGPGQTIAEALERDACSLARAPQGCRTEDLYQAHVASRKAHLEFIDSISMLAHFGHTVYTVEGPLENIKVTTPLDYYAFKGYMDARDQRMLWAGE